MPDKKLRLGVLISGSGTNLQAIIDACAEQFLDAEVVVVVSDKEAAYGLERARKAHIAAVWVDRTAYTTFRDYNHAILFALRTHEVDLVVMAGYMRLLTREVLDAFPMRVVNIHPALLPSFPGASGIHDAFDHGVKITGVTVHFATDKFDEGPIIAQEAVPVLEGDTAESLEARIHEAEHRLYPAALQLIAEGRVSIEGRKARIIG
ncbi:MAG: phosphoribosylglycinamide formyltransferase [Coriobacteriaceae bacterium]|nr:phosphoribosylglycinamide formyltransferase [Coriobacteriaceae bacterium]